MFNVFFHSKLHSYQTLGLEYWTEIVITVDNFGTMLSWSVNKVTKNQYPMFLFV